MAAEKENGRKKGRRMVLKDIKRLCGCLVDQAVMSSYDGDYLLSSLQPPSCYAGLGTEGRERAIRKLVRVTYDLILLRKWVWFESWKDTTHLSPLLWCQTYSYGYWSRGSERDGERLNTALASFTSECHEKEGDREAVLMFLSLLARDTQSPQHSLQMNTSTDTSTDSGVFCSDVCHSSVFEEVPGSCQLTSVGSSLSESSSLFASQPGSGFRGFIPSERLTSERQLKASTLFDGLTHSTTDSLNISLDLPSLPSHPHFITILPPPPSLLTKVPNTVQPSSPPPPPSPPLFWSDVFSSETQCYSRSWEGLPQTLPYLSEAGKESLQHALYLSNTHLPQSQLKPILHCQTPPSGRSFETKGCVEIAFESAVTRLQHYHQMVLDQCLNEREMRRYVSQQDLEPLSCLLQSVSHHSTTNGLEILDGLYSQCCRVQGTVHYPLLLSLLSLSIAPYSYFLTHWVFEGLCDEKEEFGIHSNHQALQNRDQLYWTEGYIVTEQCTPTFLSQYNSLVLTCGKSLNFLRLLQPQHPLCGSFVDYPPITMATSLEQLEELTQQCQNYQNRVRCMIEEEKKQLQIKVDKERHKELEQVLIARRRAREAILAVKAEEERLEIERHRTKREWLLELQTRATEARMLKKEMEREEKERDREMVAVLVGRDEAMSVREKKLAEEARNELLVHYEALGRKAELRRQRAEWRQARWLLADKRKEWIQRQDDWEREEEGMWRRRRMEVGEEEKMEKRNKEEEENGQEKEIEDNVLNKSEITMKDEKWKDKDLEEEGEEDGDRVGPPTNDEEMEATNPVVTGTTEKHTNHQDTMTISSNVIEHIPSSPYQLTTYQEEHPHHGVVMVTRGHAPPSTIADIIHNQHHMIPHPSSRGKPPPSTIQQLLYPVITEETTPSLQNAPPTTGREFPCAPPQPYTLSLSQLNDEPDSDILTGCIGPSPVQHGINPNILLFPLPSLLAQSLSLPLTTQSHLVNSALLDYFLTSCHVTSHFLSLKRFLLLEDGEFGHSLATQLFNKLQNRGGVKITSPAFLNPLLQSALNSSLHGNTPHTELLTFTVGSTPPAHPFAVDALNFLQLRYKVGWPCNVIITEQHLKKYNRVFHLLLQLRRAQWNLKIVFTDIQRCDGLDKQHKRQLQIHRHELQHFVGVMESYVTNQLFYLSWRELEEELANKVLSLDDLISAHQSFIDKAIFRCLLSKKAAPVMKIIQNIFSCILKFSTTLASSALPSPLHLFKSMTRTHLKFRDTAGLLMKVIIKLVKKGYQPHLEDFLLRLNFNNFYG